MIRYFHRQPTFWLVSAGHAWWIFLLCLGDDPLRTTPMVALNLLLGGSRIWAILLLTAGIAGAWWSLYGKRNGFHWRVPQLFTVGMTLFADLRCIVEQHYANLDPQPWSTWKFISADQIWFVLVSLGYLLTTRRRAA